MTTTRKPPTRTRRLHESTLLLIAAAPLAALLVLPLVAMLLGSRPGVLLSELGEVNTRLAIGLSLTTTAISMSVTLLLGTPLAFLLVRSRWAGTGVLTVLLELPIVLPPSVAGLALLLTWGRQGIVGRWLEFAFEMSFAATAAAVVMVQLFVAAPLYVRATMNGFAAVPDELADAVAVDGAGTLSALFHVYIPAAHTSLIAGAALAWARALGEFGATIIFAGNLPGSTQTMPLAVYIGLERSVDNALALALILVGLSVACLIIVRQLGKRTIDVRQDRRASDQNPPR